MNRNMSEQVLSKKRGIISAWYWVYLLISVVILIPGIFFLITSGLRPSVDFTGGSTIEMKITPKKEATIDTKTLQAIAGESFAITQVTRSGDNQVIVRGSQVSNETKDVFLEKITKEIGPVEEKKFETLGATLGKELVLKTAVALILSAVVIATYLAFRFRSATFGVFAMIAALHDALILLGTFSILGRFWNIEIDTLFVTALLTILSFSVHDTIVVYDRIRERKKKTINTSVYEVIDQSAIETLPRSIRNSLAIIFMLVSLFLLGGETIQWFVFALLLGTITGTYSSTFTALPLLILWEKAKMRLKKEKRK